MKHMQKAFTLIEFLLVIAIILTIAFLSAPFLSNFFNQNAVSNTVDQLAGELRKAQIYAMEGRQNSNWGVNVSSTQITLYEGNSYATRTTAFDEVFTLSPNISATNAADINFYRMTGTPSATPTFTISEGGKANTLAINSQGIVSKGTSYASNPTATPTPVPTATPTPSTPWFNTAYLYKKTITISHLKVSGGSDLTNFPVLISMTDPNLKSQSNGGFVFNTTGYDIIFTDSTQTTKLDHEIENYSPTTGEIEMWVRIPTLSASSDTVIYMYYDNNAISSSQANPTGVWNSNYVGVWHLGETSGTTNANSTSVASLTMTKISSGHPAPTTGGKIDGAQVYNNPGNGSSNATDYDSVSDNANLDFGSSQDFTVAAWVKTSQGQLSNYFPAVVSKEDAASTRQGYNILIHDGTTSAPWFFEIWQSNNNYRAAGSSNVADGNWHFLVGKRQGSTLYSNQDGNPANSTSASSGSVSKAIPMEFGDCSNCAANASPNRNLVGTIDEVEISKVALSDGWIATEYNSQSSPSTFFSVGAQTGQ